MRCLFLFIFTLLLSGCASDSVRKSSSDVPSVSDSLEVENRIHLRKLGKLSVYGDFNGDGKQDSICQGNISRLLNMEIDSAPDPFKEDWDKTVVSWYNIQEADVYLTMAGIHDTLTLGSGQGLYCLLNIGDNNADGKDEIAFVVDYCDNSRVNDCRIYSLCNGKWAMLLEFGVHEDAFNFTSDTIPYFSEIPDFLVKQNGAWVFKDYRQDGWDKPEDVGAFKKLELPGCRK